MKIQREIFFLVMTKRNGSFYFSKMHEIHFSPLFLVRIFKKKKKGHRVLAKEKLLSREFDQRDLSSHEK